MTIVHVHHARTVYPDGQPGYCVPGMRKWFAHHDLDFREFVLNGLDATVLEATGDAMALAVVAVAKAAEEEQNG